MCGQLDCGLLIIIFSTDAFARRECSLLLPPVKEGRGIIQLQYAPRSYLSWSEKSPALGLELLTLGIQGQRLHHSYTEPLLAGVLIKNHL